MPASPPWTPLPDVTTALAWRDWETGLAEALRRRVPMLAFAEPPWANSAQRLGLVLGQDAALRGLLEETFVPVLADPLARPDLVSRWRVASIALAGTNGPPLLVLLSHEGRPFLSYGTMWPEGRAPHPSLAALARATAEAYARDPEAIVAEARALDTHPPRDASPAYRSANGVWQALAGETDPRYGGMRESPKHPRPQLLWLLLRHGASPESDAFVRTTLGAMARGGIRDQIGAGFHRCARDERWIVPHFEKPVPLSAQLSAVYAAAAHRFHDDAWLGEANALAAFCLEMLRAGVDAVASDSHYYTWTSREMMAVLDPALRQAVSLHFNTVPDRSRQVLYRARNAEAIAEFGAEEPQTLRQRLEDGRRQLCRARERRRPPAPVSLPVLSWPATTIHWLMCAAEQGGDVPVGELAEHLDRLTVGGFREGIGYARPGAAAQGWLEDQAAVLAAMLAAFRATREGHWLKEARALADAVMDFYWHQGEGGWLDQPQGSGVPELSRAVVDDVLPSAVATATAALAELGELLAEDRYEERARRGAATHLPGPDSGPWAAAMWQAWFEIV